MKRFNILRRRGLRFRITFTYILTSVTLAVLLSSATFLAVRGFLGDQRVRSSTRQTILGLLFAREFFLGGIDEDPEELVALLQTRSGFQALMLVPNDFYSTTLSITPEAIPPDLQALVRDERFAYAEATLDEQRVLIYGSPLPPEDTDLYLIYSLDDIDQMLSVLLRVLLVTSATAVVFAALAAQNVSARIIRPLTEVSGAARRVAEGLLETRVRSVSRDEVGLLAASFNEMAAAFQEMIARERRFVANVSHELRTPLATLRTASELLLRHRAEFSPTAREAVDLLDEDVTNLRHLVEELMEVSEVDAGRARLRMEELDVQALLGAITTRHHREVPISGPPITIVSDKARLDRILGNLLDNAFEHGEGAGVAIDVAERNGTVRIAVSDRGPGIAPAEQPLLFDRFYKADSSRTRERGGVGLGLAIALENARLLGGTIEVASTPSDRTTFTLVVPTTAQEEELG